MKRFFFLLIIQIMLISCVRSQIPPVTKTLPKTSPIRVVSAYLDALKNNDFRKAYSYITFFYAGNLDPESYELNMKRGFVEKYHWELLDYEIEGVQVFGDQAYVTAVLKVNFKPLNSSEIVNRNLDIQYILSSIDSKWKINADDLLEKDLTSSHPESE